MYCLYKMYHLNILVCIHNMAYSPLIISIIQNQEYNSIYSRLNLCNNRLFDYPLGYARGPL
jgi:ATP sulfurylase